jgi:hypothetical protein
MDTFDDAPEELSAHECLMTVHRDNCISYGASSETVRKWYREHLMAYFISLNRRRAFETWTHGVPANQRLNYYAGHRNVIGRRDRHPKVFGREDCSVRPFRKLRTSNHNKAKQGCGQRDCGASGHCLLSFADKLARRFFAIFFRSLFFFFRSLLYFLGPPCSAFSTSKTQRIRSISNGVVLVPSSTSS